MFKKLIVAAALFFTVGVSVTHAKTITTYASPSPVATASPTPSFNSFETFWPLVAGKNMESKVYFLKLFKEKVRETLIFGKPEKADYEMFLATKRLLETESLLQGSKNDLATKTADAAITDLQKAKDNISDSQASIPQDVKNSINQRKDKLQQYVLYLKTKYSDFTEKLNTLSELLTSIVV